ncbi:hypothetical protein ANN_14901 [Periplaneta americana]|uniref:Uncharacterized protein n=1 Tax=Periplaneta americana TaxID=6978 RepID=A0ABQ8SZ72_PERAM|nr:hypothetical protein ANN_14901 [Periplaneta americana]
MLAGSEFQSLGRAIVKKDEYEKVRWDGIVSIVSWRERVFRLWLEERINETYPGRWICRGGVISWPPRSPDLTPLGYCVWAWLKGEVYKRKVEIREELLARILYAFAQVKECPNQQHSSCLQELQSALKLTVNFLNMFCKEKYTIEQNISRTHRHDTTVHDVIRLLIPALYKNQSDSLMATDGDCHHLCKLMAPVRHRWSINDVIGGIRNTAMPSDCSSLDQVKSASREGKLEAVL